MSDSLEGLRKKIEGAGDLGSVVRTMKVMAASQIGQYEMAVRSLEDYYRTIALGIAATFAREKMPPLIPQAGKNKEKSTGLIVFGSDQGLVGRFNDSLADFVLASVEKIPGKKKVWAIGERVGAQLADEGFEIVQQFPIPNSVSAITSVVGQILILSGKSREEGEIETFTIFHNRPKPGVGYEPVNQRWLPLDEQWRQEFSGLHWPTKNLPQVIGQSAQTLSALLREYLFVSLFKACAESLASENASRLNAMQRAERNIDELVGELGHTYNRLRQSIIDEELFDVIAGFGALKNENSI